MKTLIIGNGGREHALAWKAAQSKKITHVFVAPGNAGTALEPDIENVNISATDIPSLLAFARDNQIDLTIVGPEAPLVDGIVDSFVDAGLRCFGPTQAAAQLEGSKVFCKDFLARHKIPTARYGSFTDAGKAKSYISSHPLPLVIKADGLAAGKGVIIAHTFTEAESAIDSMLADDAFGEAGNRIVIEEFLAGEEASFMVIADGEHALPFATSQDHKARDDGDKGPNTGGMGAYSPAPVVTPDIEAHIMEAVITPTLRGMAADGHPYTGFLYAGLMISPKGDVKVLEYNCRLGDPETQVLMLRLQSDLVTLCQAALDQTLDKHQTKWDPRCALGVVLASQGYPAKYPKGEVINGLPANATDNPIINEKVFHAGTKQQDGDTVTAGGRVLCAAALGDTVSEAQQQAYQLAETIQWPNRYYRTDIGYRAIAREKSS